MVLIQVPELSLAGAAFTSGRTAAFLLPTAFSGLTIEYGGESCLDNPDPASMAGAVFIPNHHAGFMPQLADIAKFRCSINGRPQFLYSGLVDEFTIDDVDGPELPELIPNSRNMTDPAGWAASWGTAPGQHVVVPDVVNDRLTISPPKPAEFDYTQFGYITTPAAPVVPGAPYRLTFMSLDQLGQAEVHAEWLDGAGALLWSQNVYPSATAGWQGEWHAGHAGPFYGDWQASTVRFVFKLALRPAGNDQPNTVGLSGVVLHELLPGRENYAGEVRPAGRYLTFKSSDITATAARLMVGTTPWTGDTVAGRTDKLNGIVPAGVVSFGYGDYQNTWLGARDVDRQSALEIFQRVSASNGDTVAASPLWDRSIVPLAKPRYRSVLDVVNGQAVVLTDPSIAVVPARAIAHAPLQTAITDMSNQVRVEYRAEIDYTTAEDGTVTFTNDASVAAFGPMARSIATDLAAPTGPAMDRAERITKAQAAPTYRLPDSVQLVQSQLPDGDELGELYSPDTGYGRLVRITGGPALLGEYHRVRGAVSVFGRQPSLVLDIEPENHAAPAPVSLLDIQRSPYTPGMTFGNSAGVTIGELRTASRKDYYS